MTVIRGAIFKDLSALSQFFSRVLDYRVRAFQ